MQCNIVKYAQRAIKTMRVIYAYIVVTRCHIINYVFFHERAQYLQCINHTSRTQQRTRDTTKRRNNEKRRNKNDECSQRTHAKKLFYDC